MSIALQQDRSATIDGTTDDHGVPGRRHRTPGRPHRRATSCPGGSGSAGEAS